MQEGVRGGTLPNKSGLAVAYWKSNDANEANQNEPLQLLVSQLQ